MGPNGYVDSPAVMDAMLRFALVGVGIGTAAASVVICMVVFLFIGL